jgi:toxin CcdB
MAQYDVYANPNPDSRKVVPFVVDIQSSHLDHFATRLTMPLLRLEAEVAHASLPRSLVPRLRVGDETLVLYAHQAAVLELRLLKKPVASLAPFAAEIVGAMDAVISGL